MALNAINGCLALTPGEMDYIRFGSGKLAMVMLPSVGGRAEDRQGMALPFALMYRPLASDFTVYVFRRLCADICWVVYHDCQDAQDGMSTWPR